LSGKADTMNDIMTQKQLTAEIEASVKGAMEEFLGLHEFEGKAA